ncbi:hypothetical protein GGR50DRAFT_12889 [Xylaria sp. CBS 124048]|nr:hypothetical protein GGR50DRAFT_12889 [Xylaria sp. CBS 124048]
MTRCGETDGLTMFFCPLPTRNLEILRRCLVTGPFFPPYHPSFILRLSRRYAILGTGSLGLYTCRSRPPTTTHAPLLEPLPSLEASGSCPCPPGPGSAWALGDAPMQALAVDSLSPGVPQSLVPQSPVSSLQPRRPHGLVPFALRDILPPPICPTAWHAGI